MQYHFGICIYGTRHILQHEGGYEAALGVIRNFKYINIYNGAVLSKKYLFFL